MSAQDLSITSAAAALTPDTAFPPRIVAVTSFCLSDNRTGPTTGEADPRWAGRATLESALIQMCVIQEHSQTNGKSCLTK